jgi:N-terminal domain of unknown function (DUF4140)
MTAGPTIILAAALAALTPPAAPRRAPAGKVPDLVWSATTAASAALVAAPIAEVTVFSDRARVRRRGRGPAASGLLALRFPSLPGAALLDTIRVASSGGRVLRVEATPVQRERSAVAQATKLLDALEVVADRLAEVDDRVATDEWEVGFLRALTPPPLVAEEKREGRKSPPADSGLGGRGSTSWPSGRAPPAARSYAIHLPDSWEISSSR